MKMILDPQSNLKNMILDYAILLFLLLLLRLCVSSQISASPSCPIDLNYVLTIPWETSSCQNNPHPTPNCCQTLTSLYGIGIARYLSQTSRFRLQSLQTSVSCLTDFQTKLGRLDLHVNLTSSCFSPQRFIDTADVCASIQTKQDWLSLLGQPTVLDKACKKDLRDPNACDACVLAGFRVQSRLLDIDGDTSHSKGCFYYTILYAAGVVNELGPESDGSISCIFGLPLVSQTRTKTRKWALVFGSAGAGFGIVLIVSLFGFWMIRRFLTTGDDGFSSLEPDFGYDGLLNWRPKEDSLWFTIQHLEKATDNFLSKNLIGKGRFGNVYKGKLQDGKVVAVKEVMDQDSQGGDVDFFCREVEIISTLKHRNLVPLRGCCVSDRDHKGGSEKYLVYDYMPNGSLDEHLYPIQRRKLTWPKRKSIILDVANALAYLHYGVKPPIYHRDIKPTNILLDSCMRARVADFGLAKQGVEGESHLTTRIAGTHGYLAPEYALYGHLTEKSDVYSFGIVILETMCGRKALDLSSSALLITDWAWPLVKDGKLEEVLDPFLLGSYHGNRRYPKMVMERFVMVGILCAHLMVALRPTVLDALKMLEGDIEVPSIPDRPFSYV